jgi:C4-dicarboxylate transporter DctM subunit
MDPFLLGILGIMGMFALILLRVPIGISMAVVGIVGYGLMSTFGSGFSLVSSVTATSLSNMDLSVIPLFLLMGNFAAASGISTDMYNLANAFLGHRRGGLAMATIGGCGLFGAVCGSSLATAATFARVAHPEMIKRGYSPSLAGGCCAAGGTLGSIVPPSVILVIYGILSEQFIVTLFIAALIPAAITILLYIIAISIYVRIKPDAGPAVPKTSWSDRMKMVYGSGTAIILILIIAVGIYGGIFTVNEAAALGAIVAFLLTLIRRKMTWPIFWDALIGTAITTGLSYTILIGASIFNYFIVISHIPSALTESIIGSGWNTFFILIVLLTVYIILGSIFDTVSAMIITLPFVLPLIIALGYSPIWWGVMNVVICEIGMITPPIGMNVFIIQGMLKENLSTLFKGVIPFLCADFVRICLIAIFPGLSLWLPNLFLMK